MSVVFNEQTKLLATALNTAATSCFTVGIATPVAGYVYNVSNLQMTLSAWTLVLGVAGWLSAAIILHLLARRTLRGLVS
ncbi:hypothetical protein [Methylobacterium sp. J-068]|uniref:hypothetical protein n=1 Tax=Methylobacterium sp. J-068 TaxID=2836649 RepID=UPI001FBAE72A|nr:hypothetical protein [Methylobacterium sp. J-068]MCJ2036663.1 hypothetical protein [Methylobacterium sp. J-068]